MKRATMQRAMTTLAAALLVVGFASTSVRADYVPGAQVQKRVDQVMTKIDWLQSVDDLKSEAAKKGKLIFWLQIVGELDGGL